MRRDRRVVLLPCSGGNWGDRVVDRERAVAVKLSDFPAHVQKRLIADNPDVFGVVGGLPNSESQHHVVATSPAKAGGQGQGEKGVARRAGQGRVLVTITSYRRKLLDGDNLQGGAKKLRDEIARTIGLDDADPRLKFEYGQVQTTGKCGTVVKIQVCQKPN